MGALKLAPTYLDDEEHDVHSSEASNGRTQSNTFSLMNLRLGSKILSIIFNYYHSAFSDESDISEIDMLPGPSNRVRPGKARKTKDHIPSTKTLHRSTAHLDIGRGVLQENCSPILRIRLVSTKYVTYQNLW